MPARLLAFILFALAGPALAADVAGRGLVIDKATKTVSIAAEVAPRKLPNLTQTYPIEVVATFPAPRGQKAHETVVTYDVKPSDVHKALVSLGLKPGKPILGDGTPQGPEVAIFLEVPGEDGKPRRVPIEETLIDKKTGKTMQKVKWLFTGSDFKFPDPEKDDKVYGADFTGTLITVLPVTNDTVFQTDLTIKQEKTLKLEVNGMVVPKIGTPVKLVIQAK